MRGRGFISISAGGFSNQLKSTTCGGVDNFSARTWLKRVFYKKAPIPNKISSESLTLTNLKKNDVLKQA
jgi:hypothetical protein